MRKLKHRKVKCISQGPRLVRSRVRIWIWAISQMPALFTPFLCAVLLLFSLLSLQPFHLCTLTTFYTGEYWKVVRDWMKAVVIPGIFLYEIDEEQKSQCYPFFLFLTNHTTLEVHWNSQSKTLWGTGQRFLLELWFQSNRLPSYHYLLSTQKLKLYKILVAT